MNPVNSMDSMNPMEPASSAVLAGRERFVLAEDEPHLRRMLERVAGCALIVGMRLHALIYAASQWVPMVGVSYDPKIDAFLNRLEMRPIGTTEDLDPAKTAAEIIRLLDGREQWIGEKRDTIEKLREESRRPAQQITAYLRSKG